MPEGSRRFPPPWRADRIPGGYVVRDDNGQELAYIYARANEAEARQAKRGIWSQPNPIAPWEWRGGKGTPVTAGVVGNRRSRVYHDPHCRGVGVMKAENRVEFDSPEQAEAAGYRKAGDCN